MKTHYKAIVNHIIKMIKKVFKKENNINCEMYFMDEYDMTCDIDVEYKYTGMDVELITVDEDNRFYGYVFDNWDEVEGDEQIVYISKN